MFSTEHEAVCFCHDPESGLKAIIAIHSTTLGPALGGTRIYPYRSQEEALQDVRELSRAMTFKAAAANLPFGGGKAVVLSDWNDPEKRRKLKAFCRFINLFEGNFQTGEDLGTTSEDIAFMREFTRYAHCTSSQLPDDLQTSALTARGVMNGIEASLQHRLGSGEIAGKRIAIQGLGKVGFRLAGLLVQKGARVIVADINASVAINAGRSLKCEVVDPADIYSADVDVFCPCASGRILSQTTIDQLKATVVAGCANNQLAEEAVDRVLRERGILYAPDYVINAGGLMSATLEMGIEDEATMLARVDGIGSHLLQIYQEADRENCTPLELINKRVLERLELLRRS